METRLNYVLIGSFFFVSLMALIVFVYWFGKHDRSLRDYGEYYVYMSELPKNVRKETIVYYLGIPVGFVKDYALELNQNSSGVKLVLWIKKEIKIKKGASIEAEQALLGNVFLTLVQGSGEYFSNSDTPMILGFSPNWMDKFSNKAEALVDKVDSSLNRFNALLSDDNLLHFKTTLSNLSTFSASLESTMQMAQREITQIGKIRQDLDFSINRGDYNLRLILSPLVFNLNELINQSQDLVNEVEQSPMDFLFGVRENKLGPREK